MWMTMAFPTNQTFEAKDSESGIARTRLASGAEASPPDLESANLRTQSTRHDRILGWP